MLATVLETILTLIEGLLPTLGVASTSVVAQILVALIQIVPIVAQEATDLIVPIKNIIAALQTSGAVTADQLLQLQDLDAQCDAAFDAAAASTTVKHHRLRPPNNEQ